MGEEAGDPVAFKIDMTIIPITELMGDQERKVIENLNDLKQAYLKQVIAARDGQRPPIKDGETEEFIHAVAQESGRLAEARANDFQEEIFASTSTPATGTPQPIVKIIEQSDRGMILEGPSGRIELKNEEGSGWMTIGDWNNWKTWVRHGEHRRAQRHKDGYNAKAQSLINGATIEQADIDGGAHYNAAKSAQHREARKSGYQALASKTTKILHEKGGVLLATAGAIVTVIPVIGWVAGPLISLAGAGLTMAQQAKFAARVAKHRQQDLMRLKEQWLNGEISDAEYQFRVNEIGGQEAAAFLEEMAAEVVARESAEAEDQQAAEEDARIYDQAPAPSPAPPRDVIFTKGIKAEEPEEKKGYGTAIAVAGVGAGVLLLAAALSGGRK
jgi:hypothetical protein